ncbi:MAG: SMC-Scp complex subunit ScpB [Planctomycetes bacterium]|nr:SMC-Scp complex subunit ScpB [Planctomycetota bacterium]MBL7008921.1 SMC-Scp complex subunit ScpB [Planctomycetota bacterium]
MFASPEPVTLDRVREVLFPQVAVEDDPEAPAAAAERHSPRQYLDALEDWMSQRGLPLTLRQVGKAYRLLTTEDVAEALISVRKKVHQDRLGPAALEVLSLVAYRQPVLKADIDAIRGVKSGPHLRHLLDLRLARILGRADLPGRPFLYGTTREFLDRFGLRGLDELPEAGRLAVPVEAPPAEPAEPAESVAAAEAIAVAAPTPDSPASGHQSV